MRKASGKRLPHGATADMVLGALVRLYAGAGQKPVSRWTLVRKVPLPETTVDDRLRVLLARGDVVRLGERGQYRYAPAAKGRAPDPVQAKEKQRTTSAMPVQSPPPQQVQPKENPRDRPEISGGGYYFLRPGIDF